MDDLPPGFRFHKGLDGLIVGFSIVFLVKAQLVISSFINWWQVPTWAYEPILNLISSITGTAEGIANAIGSGVQVGGGSGSGGANMLLSNPVVSGFLSGGIKFLGIPVLLTGTLRAGLVHQLLIVIGFWIGVLVPLWWWGLRPAYFSWQDVEEEEPEEEVA